MKRIIPVLVGLLSTLPLFSQGTAGKLAAAFRKFENDPQLKSALAGIYVLDAATGRPVFEKNGTIGLAPASTQKIVTSITAYALLGPQFRYRTDFGYRGTVANGVLRGDVVVRASGDPTLGSWRWHQTGEEKVLEGITAALQKEGIRGYRRLAVEQQGWDFETVPDGWIWQDIGNYYGAGAAALNWRENQYDIVLRSGGGLNSAVQVVETVPKDLGFSLTSAVTAAEKGSGDNAYVYYPLLATGGIVRGTIPVNEQRFVIAGALPDPAGLFGRSLAARLAAAGIAPSAAAATDTAFRSFHTVYSPVLDSMIYWFNQKSINLYGEALVKTLAFREKGMGATDAGTRLIRDFWKDKGIAAAELNIVDGSGLSPLNRITPRAQATLLHYAYRQSWYPGFYHALPVYNGMKMKSGTIRGVKGFTGYHKAGNGTTYIFSFLVNNYNGSASALVQKMYQVLDVLK